MDEATILQVATDNAPWYVQFVDHYGLWAVGYLLAAYFIYQNQLLQRTVQDLLRDAIASQGAMTSAIRQLTEWVKDRR